ncbi:CPBP family intramembrane glutamic endopeptidase [Kribbella sp. NPDC051770]|uniref:CPBP family intramembrane glutamic endopeptidase n=1 Tax=Kribbella sp. NPDC051770 TaxID=3155413 RepID=UPI0034274AE1
MSSQVGRFLLICFGLSWAPWIVLGATGANVDEGPGALVFGLAASGPSLAALVMWLRYRSRLPRQTAWAWHWPVVAVVLGAAPPLLAALLTGVDDIPHHASTVIAGAGGPLGALAYTLLAGPLSEEFGWRGYLQPRLRRSYGQLAVTGMIGAAWGIWHLPLFFLEGTGQHDKGLISLEGLLFFLGLFPLTYTILFVSERLRGGVWAAILVHAAWNLTEELVPALSATGLWVEFALTTLIAVSAALVWKRTGSPTPTLRGGRRVSR